MGLYIMQTLNKEITHFNLLKTGCTVYMLERPNVAMKTFLLANSNNVNHHGYYKNYNVKPLNR